MLILLINNIACIKEKEPRAKQILDTYQNVAAKLNFSEVTMEAGLRNFRHDNGSFGKMWFPEQMGSGCGFIDYNGDGCLLNMFGYFRVAVLISLEISLIL